MSHPQPRQQSGLNDLQLLQRHIMFKQLQEMQRQQQFQGLGDTGQQNYVINLSTIHNQASGGPFPPLINGTPIRDVSQLNMVGNMNLVQHGSSQVVQGSPNGLAFSQAQNQALRTMGSISQDLDASLYGTPVCSTRNKLNQFSNLQGASGDSPNNLLQIPINQQPVFNSSMNGQYSEDMLVYQENNFYGQVSKHQDFGNQAQPGSFQQLNPLQRNASIQDFGRRQEQSGWPAQFSGTPMKVSSSQSLVSLDPLEEKILFNTEDTGWDASFGRGSNMSSTGLGSSLDHPECLSSFPSIQSGSWSALMQSAVAETSSRDIGFQEEWSSLSFQTPEHLTDNQPSNFDGGGKQETQLVSSNFQGVSSVLSKTEALFNSSGMNSPNLHDFQLSGRQFSVKLRQGMYSVSSHESTHQSRKNTSEWVGREAQHKQPIDGSRPLQMTFPVKNNDMSGNYEVSDNIVHQPSLSLNYNSSQCYNDTKGDSYHAVHKDPNGLWKTEKSPAAGFSVRENSHLTSFAAIPKSSTTEFEPTVDQETRLSGDNCFQRENSIDSHHSNTSQHKITGRAVRENVWMPGIDVRHVAGGIQQPFSQGHSPEIQGYLNPSEELRTRMIKGFNALNATAQTSQTTDELVDKADKCRDDRNETQFRNTYLNPFYEVLQAESLNTSALQAYNKSFDSRNCSLKLAPPSHHPPNSNILKSAQSPQIVGNCAVTSSSGLPYMSNQFQSQHMPTAPVAHQFSQQMPPHVAGGFPEFNPSTSLAKNSPCFPVSEAVPVAQSIVHPEFFPTRTPNLWTNALTQRHVSGTEPPIVTSTLLSASGTTNAGIEIASRVPHVLLTRNSFQGNSLLETDACYLNSLDANHAGEKSGKEKSHQQIPSEILDTVSQTSSLFHGAEAVENHLLEANVAKSNMLMTGSVQQASVKAPHYDSKTNPSMSARDLEAINGSLKQSSVIHQNNSSMKSIETFQDKSVMARSLLNGELYPTSQINFFSTENNKMMSFSLEARGDHLAEASLKPVHNDIPQEMCDVNVTKNAVQQFSLGKPFENFHLPIPMGLVNSDSANQVETASPKAAINTVSGRHTPSPFVLSPDITCQGMAVVRPQKRKIAPFKLLPWHKELGQGYKRIQDIRTAEVEWAHATNRRIEKVEDEAENFEDGLLMLRPKRRRLILTTQLMQQMFQAAPALILSANATLNFDSVAYFAARLALGDACYLISESYEPSNASNMSLEKCKSSNKIGDQDISKNLEDFIHRSKILESNFLRLDKRSSILDMMVEYQELEKFSIINRFAKFHTRGQAGAAETSSGTTSTAMKLFPQRYVTAIPMPRTVPEAANCFSL